MQSLKRGKAMQMATTAPVLEREQNLRSATDVRELEGYVKAVSVSADPMLHTKLGCLCSGSAHPLSPTSMQKPDVWPSIAAAGELLS
jgi:hypothetical protein